MEAISKVWKGNLTVETLTTEKSKPFSHFQVDEPKNMKIKLSYLRPIDGSNYVQSSMFGHSKPNIWCLGLITSKWTRLSSFDVQKNDGWVSSMSDLVKWKPC